ncbi:uncharacterized protein PODANS_4_8055 [Podospora anserina S mat+]|uniref:Podospora anserina S mat+ genomic DNA chromosome 4, supercontig 4 n=1 Tax=Podospora anserina (strain S / ATCC MYA-4624 / DSM 980 / FGSC 10383) TaxID=515849 RepID=B2ARB4_PODAN|nr:uncharacterized protein PODANS_4_8055 [Podospora anserina S mat+]CAP66692.1 unnamed protein product [Podospora anserina S mat+]CDP28427.1 Putative protein of unknown function [Podospora anserina S mat+]
MKFLSVIAPVLLVLSGPSIASPTPEPEYPTISNTTVVDELLAKRATCSGSLSTWTSSSTTCTGTAGQVITNPNSGQCYTHGSGAAQLFRRALWSGSSATVTFYSSTNCNPGTVVSTTTTGLLCWAGWEFWSFKVTC